MKALSIAVSTVATALLVSAGSATLAADSQSAKDQERHMNVTSPEFVKKAGAAGLAEVAMGKLGSSKATNPDVQAYARKMVTDHTKANNELKAAASAKSLEVPSEPDMMHKGMMKKFDGQKADADFDHDFMQQMVRDHQKVIELFESAASDQNVDADLRALAKKTLPTLREHLKSAEALESKLGKS
jgi:putative membrane protein